MCHARPLLYRATEAVGGGGSLGFLLHENLGQVWGNSIKRFDAISCFFSVDALTTNQILAVHWTSLF